MTTSPLPGTVLSGRIVTLYDDDDNPVAVVLSSSGSYVLGVADKDVRDALISLDMKLSDERLAKLDILIDALLKRVL